MTILIGTSGFSYKDWVGPVYPEGLPKQEWPSCHAVMSRPCSLPASPRCSACSYPSRLTSHRHRRSKSSGESLLKGKVWVVPVIEGLVKLPPPQEYMRNSRSCQKQVA
jgi:hypothetical protein